MRAASNFIAPVATPLIRQMFVFFFQELNSIKDCIHVHKKKKKPFFSFFVLFVYFFLEGASSQLCWEKGGNPKNFLMMRGGGVIIFYKSFSSNPTSTHYPTKNERSINLKR